MRCHEQDASATWVKDGLVVPGEQLAQAWGLTRHALAPAAERGEVFAVKVGNRRYYPQAFLGMHRESVATVCRAPGDLGSGEKRMFWLRDHGALAGKRVAAALETGVPVAKVKRLAGRAVCTEQRDRRRAAALWGEGAANPGAAVHAAGDDPRQRQVKPSMAPPRKVIITCAVTGAIHTPSMSPHLPITPRQIADEAVAAAEAGAAILHLHARDPATGRPDQTPQAFARFLPQIHERSDAVINLTTGGGPYMLASERVRPAAVFEPEVASLNMGSMRLGLFPMLARFKTFEHDWERGHLEATRDLVFKNTFADIEMILATCGQSGTRFEFECFDTAHLYNLAHVVDRGLVKPPFFVQTVFGLLGGIGAHGDDVAHIRRTADRLFRSDYQWSVLGAGKAQMRLAAISAAMGAMCAWAWKTRCGPGRAGWPAAMHSRW